MILIIFISLLLVILYFIYKQIINLINLVDSLFAIVSKNIDTVKINQIQL